MTEVFETLRDSKMTLYQTSEHSVVTLAELNNSVYYSISNGTKKNVTVVLVKFIPIQEGTTRHMSTRFLASKMSKIEKEVRIQRDVFIRSIRDQSLSSPFISLCPQIYDSVSLSKEESDELIRRHDFLEEMKGFRLHAVVMEFMRGYETVDKLAGRGTMTQIHCQMVHKAFEHLHKVGYYHGDAHLRNILLKTDEDYYDSSIDFRGRVVIVDFGEATQTDSQEHELYEEAFVFLKFSDGSSHMGWPMRDMAVLNKLSEMLMNKLREWPYIIQEELLINSSSMSLHGRAKSKSLSGGRRISRRKLSTFQ